MALDVSLKVVLSTVGFLTEFASKRSNALVKFLGKKIKVFWPLHYVSYVILDHKVTQSY